MPSLSLQWGMIGTPPHRIWQRIGARCRPRHDCPPPKKVPAPTKKDIRLAAYYLWVKAGRPVNDGVEHWLAAERYLQWHDDRGMFISSILHFQDHEYEGRVYQTFTVAVGEIVWRRGRWEERLDKVSKQKEVGFYFYGPGYRDYECRLEVYPAEEFAGVD